MGVRDLVRTLAGADAHERSFPSGWLAAQLSDSMRYGGHTYLLGNSSWGPNEAPVLSGGRQALLSNGSVYGLFRRRADLFAQGEFAFRRFGRGLPTMADIVTTTALAPLEPCRPLLEQCELDVACCGASFWTLDGGTLRNLPAEYCTIVATSERHPTDPRAAWDSRPSGLIYHDPAGGLDPETFLWSEIAAHVPERDPDARWRGMSWLRPAMEDVQSDNGARRYLTRYFDNNATPNAAVTFSPETTKETVEAFRDIFLQKHEGVDRAFKTSFLGGGADIKVIGSSLKDLDTQAVRQQVHKDIAAAAGVPVVAAGIEQGTYANSKESNRQLADNKIRYLWAAVADAFAGLVAAPSGTELFIDTSKVSALQADALDDAHVLQVRAATISSMVKDGWDPESAKVAVLSGDLSKARHTNLVSVQLMPPGTQAAPKQLPAAATNGASNG